MGGWPAGSWLPACLRASSLRGDPLQQIGLPKPPAKLQTESSRIGSIGFTVNWLQQTNGREARRQSQGATACTMHTGCLRQPIRSRTTSQDNYQRLKMVVASSECCKQQLIRRYCETALNGVLPFPHQPSAHPNPPGKPTISQSIKVRCSSCPFLSLLASCSHLPAVWVAVNRREAEFATLASKLGSPVCLALPLPRQLPHFSRLPASPPLLWLNRNITVFSPYPHPLSILRCSPCERALHSHRFATLW